MTVEESMMEYHRGFLVTTIDEDNPLTEEEVLEGLVTVEGILQEIRIAIGEISFDEIEEIAEISLFVARAFLQVHMPLFISFLRFYVEFTRFITRTGRPSYF